MHKGVCGFGHEKLSASACVSVYVCVNVIVLRTSRKAAVLLQVTPIRV
jgi:hypothetical protein